MASKIIISKEIQIIGLTLYLPQHTCLIISDIHMGYEEAMKGVMLPRFQLKDTIQHLDVVFNQIGKVNQIIITGDLKHEFGKILVQEWRNVLKFIDYLQQHTNKIILIKGNHDVMLDPVLRKRSLEYVDYLIIEDIFICHGDVVKQLPSELQKKIKTIIIGHEHCAISLRRGNRIERYKCFLTGTFEKKTLIAMPSLNLLTIGTDVLNYELLSPYLQGNLDTFEVFIADDKNQEVYSFGTIKHIKKINNA